MAVMVSNCGGDENGNLWGGKAGDQTGREYKVAEWSNWGQTAVYRHPDKRVRKTLAQKGRAAALNDLIGYDQGQRMTYLQHLRASNWDPAQVTVACEADCSSSTGANIVATGHDLNDAKLMAYDASLSTHYMDAALRAAGFQKLTASKYLSGSSHLLAGDIQLNPGYHVNIVITDGASAGNEPSGEVGSDPSVHKASFSVTAASETNVRSAPKIALGNKTGQLDPGDHVACDGFLFADGRIWATYIANSGSRRYIALGIANSWVVVS